VIFERLRHPFSPADTNVSASETASEIPTHIKFEGIRRHALETGRNRLLVTGALFMLAFAVIAGRLVELAVVDQAGEETRGARIAATLKLRKVRADITDRNGILLASSLPTASLYANPRHVLDPKEAARKLARVFPSFEKKKIQAKLASDKTFVWLHRNLTPKTQFAVNALGIPGLYFQRTERRVYPHGRMVAHALGLTNIDGRGLSGIEGYFDKSLRDTDEPLSLSLDIRVQSVLREELLKSMAEFRAIGAAGIVMDVTNGEVRAMASLPDFNPNKPVTAAGIAGFNRATKGVYEMGSTFKLFTAAMALDSGVTRLRDRFDATKPIKISRFKISDYHGKNRWLTVPEIIVYSSNIGAAKMALEVGTAGQKKYLKRFGLLTPARIELPEIGSPLTPDHWREINTMTISYGHGIAVSPLQLAAGVAALVNGGVLYNPRMIKIPRGKEIVGSRVLSKATSRKMRGLMRLVVRNGTGRNADVPGYLIGGKTGTADKPGPRDGYSGRRVISSFVAAFPMNKPRYVILALIDEPKGTQRTRGYATGGWVAAPIVARVVKRMAPILGLVPSKQTEKVPKPGDDLFIAAKATKR
jgi:cell division protein FtsI (penicillin-binding protein 3)